MKGIKVSKYGYWSDGKLQTIITDDETIKYINNKINEAKMQKDYSDFLLNIQKYEKQITDGSSSQDTNSNSKGNYKITNNITDYK
jgi:hypothetical protein